MNGNNVLFILSILVPVLLGLWAVMRNIKVDISKFRTELKEDIKTLDLKIDATKAELKEDISNLRTELKEDISKVRTELKEDLRVVRADIRSLQEMMWVCVVGRKNDFHTPPEEQQQG